jgi:hypothetical protein
MLDTKLLFFCADLGLAVSDGAICCCCSIDDLDGVVGLEPVSRKLFSTLTLPDLNVDSDAV